MTWFTSEIEYEGLPLLLRRPDHSNIWNFKDKFTQLITVEHFLEKVLINGLPDKVYNKSLADFDHRMCTLLDGTDNGLIFLIETFSGKRNYYYYTVTGFIIDPLIDSVKTSFKVNLEVSLKNDDGWGFLKAYPVQLFT